MKNKIKWFIVLSAIVFALLPGCAKEGAKIVDSGYMLSIVVKDAPLSGVNGATIGADGNLYVVHTGNNTVSRIDLKTMSVSAFVPPYAGVYICDDITSDDEGNFYVTGTTPFVGEVYRIDKNGVKTVIARGFKAPNGIQYNKQTGRLFMSECFQGNRVYELDPTGVKPPRLIVKENVIPVPEGFDFDPDTNDLIIPDLGTGRILRVHPDTGEIRVIADKLIAPVALKIGPDKMAYVPSLATPTVYRVSLDGQTKEEIATIRPGLDNLAITKDGRLFVTSYWDATIYDVATDGSGKYKTLFPMGANQISGIIIKNDTIYIADAIMVRAVKEGKYEYTKLNAWAAHGMPLPIGLADGPGNNVFWPDFVNGAVAFGDPDTGKFQPIAGGLDRPAFVLMGKDGSKIYVAEYGAGKITEVSLANGAKKDFATQLDGPIAMAMMDNNLYVAEAKTSRIRKIDMATGEKEYFLSGLAGKPSALADDGSGSLLVLDGAGQKLFRIRIQDMAVSIIAKNLPVGFALTGADTPVELSIPMAVSPRGDIFICTANRGIIKLRKN